MKIFLVAVMAVISFSMSSLALASASDSLGQLVIQDAGRLKPFDTFAKETLKLVYGKDTFKGEKGGDERLATEVVMTWILQPEAWADTPMFEVRFNELKSSLKLEIEKKYFTFNELIKNDHFPTLIQELQVKRENKEKLNPYFQALQRLENQLFTFREIAGGRMIRLVPPKSGNTWLDISSFPEPLQAKFVELTKNFVPTLGANNPEADQLLERSVQDFISAARAENPELYPEASKMQIEIHYNHFHPFKWAWIFYLLTAVLLGLVWISGQNKLYPVAWAFALTGLAMHIYGFGLRVYLMGRPPVTNMYETIIGY